MPRSTGLPARPLEDRLVGGVCAALSRRYGIDPTLLRLAFLLLALANGLGLLLYGAAWLMLPVEGSRAGTPASVLRENLHRASGAFSSAGVRAQRAWGQSRSNAWPRPLDRRWIALALVAAGATSLLYSFGLFSWMTTPRLFGLALIAAGVGALITLNSSSDGGRRHMR